MTNFIIPYSVFIFILSLAITAASLAYLIPRLRLKAKQPIYEGGPVWHMSKSGTPTMGGITFLSAFLICTPVSLLLLYRRSFTGELLSILILALFSLANGAVGMLDDTTKLRYGKNKGLTAWQKLLLQGILAAIFLSLRAYLFDDGTSLWIFNVEIPLGPFYYPISMLLILGAINCANLTDGIDGLLSSVSVIASSVLLVIALYSNPAYALISASLFGLSLAFLIYNTAPAKIFMGDTGSLFIGALIISTLFSIGKPEYFFSLGAVFIIEGVSVILQVGYFKWKRKRLFLMSPIHHHLERVGFSESRICIIAVIITVISSLPALIWELI